MCKNARKGIEEQKDTFKQAGRKPGQKGDIVMTFGLYKDQRGRYTIAREERNAKLILGSSNIERECDVSAPTYTEALRFVKKEMPKEKIIA